MALDQGDLEALGTLSPRVKGHVGGPAVRGEVLKPWRRVPEWALGGVLAAGMGGVGGNEGSAVGFMVVSRCP